MTMCDLERVKSRVHFESDPIVCSGHLPQSPTFLLHHGITAWPLVLTRLTRLGFLTSGKQTQ